MSLRATAASILVVLLVLSGCTSDAETARTALGLGKRQQASGALVDAAIQLSEAARLDPRLHEAYARLARVRLAQGSARDAETAALRAAALVPRSSYYSELLGRTQLAEERVDAAIASLEQAITLDPTQTARLAFTLGVLQERQGDPRNPLKMGSVAGGQNRVDLAENCLEIIMERRPLQHLQV